MSDFNNFQGRPIKRKRDTSCNRAGPGNRDVAEMRKDANSHNQQLPKSTISSSNNEPTAKEEKAPAVPPTAAASPAEPFKPLIRELQRLDDQNPVLAEQAARLVALYRQLWESYVANHADSSRLKSETHRLQLEKSHLERHCKEQEARSSRFQEAFQKVRDGVVEMFENWEASKAELATADSAKGNTTEKGSQVVGTTASPMHAIGTQVPHIPK
ncbi:hypothetical protein Y699_05374 [Aspergillus fumigatus Z5]|nr:hypothetical protein Y699_05374 [Aspergillus fumigatus Z5]